MERKQIASAADAPAVAAKVLPDGSSGDHTVLRATRLGASSAFRRAGTT